MAKPEKVVHGWCRRRSMNLSDDLMCDFFMPKRKSKYRVCCRNCHNFVLDETKRIPPKIEQKKSTSE